MGGCATEGDDLPRTQGDRLQATRLLNINNAARAIDDLEIDPLPRDYPDWLLTTARLRNTALGDRPLGQKTHHTHKTAPQTRNQQSLP